MPFRDGGLGARDEGPGPGDASAPDAARVCLGPPSLHLQRPPQRPRRKARAVWPVNEELEVRRGAKALGAPRRGK